MDEYTILAFLDEKYLGGEYFNKWIINYIFNIIKTNDKLKNINFNNKNDKKIVNCL